MEDTIRPFCGGGQVMALQGTTPKRKSPLVNNSSDTACEEHHLTTLIIRLAHEKVMHCGTKATLTELRSRFWIVRGRSVVRRTLRRCIVCRRHEGPAFQLPPPPPLPTLRVEEVPPFTHTGVDFAGPLYILHDITDGAKKVWVCLFTCCVV